MNPRGIPLCSTIFASLLTLACGSFNTDPSTNTGGTSNGTAGASSSAAGSSNTSTAGTNSGSAGDSSGSSGAAGAGNTGSAAGASGTAGNAGSAGTGGTTDAFKLPPANAPFDYQIGGAYTPPTGVMVISRDREAPIAKGLYNICYVNAFQTQPQDESWWDSNHPSLLLRDSSGKPVIDPDWDEILLDTSTAEKRAGLMEVVGPWIQGCKDAGYDAIEFDNLDTYSRSGSRLSESNNIAFMALLSQKTHDLGMASGQKNSAELVSKKAQMGTDFAVVEECGTYDECGDFTAGYGNYVFIIEYVKKSFDADCAEFPDLSVVYRDLNVSPAGSNSYIFDGC